VESPDAVLQRAESVTLAFLVLLEKLSPEERAAFLLKEVFGYEHAEIADMLGTTTENSRQLLRRAKARLVNGRPRLTGTAQSRRAVAERFALALSSGDGSALVALLTRDVAVWSDGGGKASSAQRPLIGRDQVLNFLIGLRRTAQAAGCRVQGIRVLVRHHADDLPLNVWADLVLARNDLRDELPDCVPSGAVA
jgi:RNA polymerase sigma-70 factor (ECF subfamily)